MRAALLRTVAFAAFMSDVVDIVVVKAKSGEFVRVNESELDDPKSFYYGLKPNGTETDKQDDPAPAGIVVGLPSDILVPPAPSAPNFAPVAPDPAAPPVDPNAPVTPTIPSPGALLVTKTGTGAKARFIVVNGTAPFDPVKDVPGIDNDGYKTQEEANDAIAKRPQINPT